MYKKYLSVSIMMLAPICANASGDYTAAIQQLDAEIARLQAQNQADLEELQECEKKVKGFKISGITTLSLTGVGIGVNIGEAVKLNKLEQQSSALDASITEKQRQKEAEEAAERERQAAAQKQKEEAEPVKQEEEQKQEEVAEVQQQQSQQPVPVKENSGNEEEKPAKKVTDTKPAEKKTTKKTSTPASKSGTQKTNQTTAKSSAAKDKKSVKEFLLSKVDVDGTNKEYWSFDGTKSSTTQYVKKKGDWAAIYDYGVITGVAKCSTTSGEYKKPGIPHGDTGKYCWCEMTQLKKTGETNFLLAVSGWVFNYDLRSDSYCASHCTGLCGIDTRANSSLRGGLFGSVLR